MLLNRLLRVHSASLLLVVLVCISLKFGPERSLCGMPNGRKLHGLWTKIEYRPTAVSLPHSLFRFIFFVKSLELSFSRLSVRNGHVVCFMSNLHNFTIMLATLKNAWPSVNYQSVVCKDEKNKYCNETDLLFLEFYEICSGEQNLKLEW